MKLVIQIPCFDEAETLPAALASLPRELPGVDSIEILVVDDGSTDGSADVASGHGADRVVRQPHHLGLARTFLNALQTALEMGADVVVNFDADNQYRAEDLPKLIEPIVSGRADMVIGVRPIDAIEDFSPVKKLLERLGSRVVRALSGVDIADAPSGFRAIGRRAAFRMNVFSEYTYTLETILQAGQQGMAVETVAVGVNPPQRPSRLVRSTRSYVFRSTVTILRIFVTYRPFRFFMALGAVVFAAGLLLGVRFLVLLASGQGQGNVQSLILAAILILMGFQLGTLGVVADLISVNRKLLEDVQRHVREAGARDGR